MNTGARKALAWKLALYYGVALLSLVLISQFLPGLVKYLPMGGLAALQEEAAMADSLTTLESFLATRAPLNVFADAMNLVFSLLGALIVMVPIRWIYMTKDLKKSINPDVASGLLVLPMVVTAIVFIVKYSLPLAFALTGIFAGVRYRTTLKNQSDAYFTFASISVGLAAGTRSLGIGLVLAIFFAYTILLSTPEATAEKPD